MQRLLLVFLVAFSFAPFGARAEEQYTFDNPEFFVQEMLTQPSVEPSITRGTFAWDFRTRIREATRGHSPNFAGRYIIVQWGCGTECQAGAIINTVTGRVDPLPISSLGVSFRPWSALLIVNPSNDDPYRSDWITEYYLWTGKEFLQMF